MCSLNLFKLRNVAQDIARSILKWSVNPHHSPLMASSSSCSMEFCLVCRFSLHTFLHLFLLVMLVLQLLQSLPVVASSAHAAGSVVALAVAGIAVQLLFLVAQLILLLL